MLYCPALYRLLECKLDRQKTHITTKNLIKTLQNMNVANVHDVEYMALYKGSKTFANQKSHIYGIFGLLTIKAGI